MHLLNWIIGTVKKISVNYQNSYQLTTKTVNCKTVNKTYWFQTKSSSYWRCSIKKVILKISQNLQESTCAQSLFFNKVAGLKLQAWGLQLYQNKRLRHSCFPMNFEKFKENNLAKVNCLKLQTQEKPPRMFSLAYNLPKTMSDSCPSKLRRKK